MPIGEISSGRRPAEVFRTNDLGAGAGPAIGPERGLHGGLAGLKAREEEDSIRDQLAALRIDRSDDAAHRRHRRSAVWIALLLILIAAVALVTWRWRATPMAEVRVVPVRTSNTVPTRATVLNASGYVTARRRATVSAKLTGKLVDVSVEEGVPVVAGQILARLDDSLHRANLDLARARLSTARRTVIESTSRRQLADLTYERSVRLATDGIIGQADLDESRTEREALSAREARDRDQVKVAEREVAVREAQMKETIVRAPFDGIVISKDAQEGEMVSPISAGGGFTRTGICTLVDMNSLEIEVDVNEAYIARVKRRQPVEAILDAYPEWKIPAHVITTIPAADRQKATVLVRIGFDALDSRILPDMGVKVAFRESGARSSEAVTAGFTIPRDAIRHVKDHDVVFVYVAGHVELRPVRIGSRGEESSEVLAGLVSGDLVVVDGPESLSDGEPVRLRPVE
ncbi:MAG: efflux RND transporter periplasmic adaptor subunit [Acidobacteriota bacterium]